MDHRKEAQRTSRIVSAVAGATGAVFAFLSLTFGLPAAAEQPTPVAVAVAPFADEVGFQEGLATWAAARLTVLLSRRGIPVVPFTQVQLALREAGRRSTDLISLAATEDLAHRVEAGAVVTGRLVRAETEPGGSIDDTPPRRIGPSESSVTFVFRLMVVSTRQTFYEEVTGYHMGGGPAGLTRAADLALERYVSRVPVPGSTDIMRGYAHTVLVQTTGQRFRSAAP